VDANKRPIFIADPKNEKIGKVLGFDIVVDDNLADETILFGNFNYMGFNLPEGIMVEASSQSSFKSGRIDYRATAIADCKPIVPEAFIKLTRAEA
jgi:HK97 family phage major capsid protein